ncbi:MAG: hypothetical protein P8X96_12130 [Desulfobacteraceae bacterium]
MFRPIQKLKTTRGLPDLVGAEADPSDCLAGSGTMIAAGHVKALARIAA